MSKWTEIKDQNYDFEALERELAEPAIKPHMQKTHIMEDGVYVTLYDGKRVEDFTVEDSIAFRIDTDIALNGKVLPDLEEAIEKAGYRYSFEGTKIIVSQLEKEKEKPTYLRLPSMEHDEFIKVTQQIKENGAKFNPFIKRWYVPSGVNLDKFKDYLPEQKLQSNPEEKEKRQIAKEINQTKKYKANRSLVENIYSLDKHTGKKHSVADLADAYKNGIYENDSEADQLIKNIGKEFIRQEQTRAIAP